MRDLENYLHNAAECRELATHVHTPEHKAQLEKIADTWKMLADCRRLRLKHRLTEVDGIKDKPLH